MKPNPQTTPEGDGARQDAQHDALYFDDEATVLARPVVPLGEVAGDSAPGAAHAQPAAHAVDAPEAQWVEPSDPARAEATPPAATLAAAYAFDASAPHPGMATAEAVRRADRSLLKSLPLALVLMAVMAGVVIGGVGFYLFQQRLRPEPAAEPEQTTEQAAAPETSEPRPAAEAPQETAEAEPRAEMPAAAPEQTARPEPDAADEAAQPRPAAETRGGAATRTAAAPREDNSKRGGREDDDDDDEDRPRARREDSPRPPRQQEPEARRVDSIVYQRQQRRAERREQRRAERRDRRSIDSVRGIFEGQP